MTDLTLDGIPREISAAIARVWTTAFECGRCNDSPDVAPASTRAYRELIALLARRLAPTLPAGQTITLEPPVRLPAEDSEGGE